MGRPFLEHLGGKKYYVCGQCKTYLASVKHVVSKTFRGATGQAYLFRSVTNVSLSTIECRNMITGAHMVRDVSCKCCEAKLGWMYEFAVEANQAYKEGHTILERTLLEEVQATGMLAKTDREHGPNAPPRIGRAARAAMGVGAGAGGTAGVGGGVSSSSSVMGGGGAADPVLAQQQRQHLLAMARVLSRARAEAVAGGSVGAGPSGGGPASILFGTAADLGNRLRSMVGGGASGSHHHHQQQLLLLREVGAMGRGGGGLGTLIRAPSSDEDDDEDEGDEDEFSDEDDVDVEEEEPAGGGGGAAVMGLAQQELLREEEEEQVGAEEADEEQGGGVGAGDGGDGNESDGSSVTVT